MRKKLSMALAILFMTVVVLTGCSNTKDTASNSSTNSKTSTVTSTPTPTPESTPTPTPAVQGNSSEASGKTADQGSQPATIVKETTGKNSTSTAAGSSKNSSTSTANTAAKVKIETAIKGASAYINNASSNLSYKINDWDAIALSISGYDLNSKEVKPGDKGYIDYKAGSFIKDNSGYYLTDYARSSLGIMAAGYDPSNFMGFDLTNIIKNSTSKDGKFLDTVNGGEDLLNCHVWSMIALEAGKVSYDRMAALKYIESHQNSDGGFYIFSAFPQSDIDFTAMTVIALTMAGRDKSSASVSKALNYLKKQSVLLPKSTNGETAETLSVILQAVVAAKDDISKYTVNGKNLADELLSFYNTDGSFKHVKSGSGNAISTRQALTALISYKNSKNTYSVLGFKKGNFYNTISQQVSSVKLHKALYDSVSGKIEISASVADADSIAIEISDGNNIYSENIVPKDNTISIEKELPPSNYSVTIKTVKNNNITSVVKESIENVSKKVNASVRVESYDRTIIKSMPLSAGNYKVYDYEGGSFTTTVLSAYTFVMKALVESGIVSSTSYGFGSPYIAGINSIFGGKFGGWDGWMYYLNGKDPGVAMSDARISDGDEILVYYGDWGIKPLDISSPDKGSPQELISVKVTSEEKPVEGAVIYVNNEKYLTDANGIAFIKIANPGVYELYAEKNDESGKPLFIRSKRLNITIE